MLLKSYVTFKIQRYTPHPNATDAVKLFSVAYKSRDCAFLCIWATRFVTMPCNTSMGLGFFEGENIG